MQMFPWFGMLRTQKNEATLMAQARYEEFREERNRLLYEVKTAYYQLHKLQNEIEISQENLEILRLMERLAIVRFQGGNTGEAAATVSSAIKKANTQVTSPAGTSMNMGGGNPPASSVSPSSSSMSGGMGSMGPSGSSGKLTDVLRIQVQIKALESQLLQLEANKIPVITRFNLLLQREKDAAIELENSLAPQNLGLDAEWQLDSILFQNPMLKMLDAESAAFSVQANMAKLEGRPMLGVGLNYMVFSPRPESGMVGMDGMEYMPGGMGRNMVMPMVTMTLPIYRKKIKAREQEANYLRESADFQKENLKNSLQIQYDELVRDIRNTERVVDLLNEQIVLMQQTLDLMVTSYATEGTSFDEILTVQRELLDFRLNLLNTVIEQYIGHAGIEMLIGY
jgi:outer membrane protein TolC